MHHLGEGMHPGIRSTRADGRDRMTRQLGEGRLELVLQGVATRLSLPASRSRAIVGQSQSDPQGRSARPATSQATSDKLGEHLARPGLLLSIASCQDLLEQLAGAFLVADLLIRRSQVELGGHLLPTSRNRNGFGKHGAQFKGRS